jgi:hypothetical protein
MSAEDLVKGLKLIEADDDLRERVGAGDLTGLGDLDLSDEERFLLTGAADDFSEVAGFAFDALFRVDGAFPGGDGTAKWSPGLQQVHDYLSAKGFTGDKWDTIFPGAG